MWEILWSDPMESAKFAEIGQAQGIVVNTNDTSYMYLPNKKRGTAFLFNEFAVGHFLERNHLQYVVRAHEVPAEGFRFHFGRLCTTIFSCSHYCKNDNEAAVVLIPQEARMRVIRIDTMANACAMI